MSQSRRPGKLGLCKSEDLPKIQSVRRLDRPDLTQECFSDFLLEDFGGEPEYLVKNRRKHFWFTGCGLRVEEEIDAFPGIRA